MGLSRLQVGAQTLVYINGRLFGRCADVGYESNTPQRFVQPIDVIVPAELVPGAAKASGTISIYRLHGDGGIQAAGMIPTWRDLMRAKYFSILVIDRFSDTVTFRADACSVTREAWRHGRGYVMGQIAFDVLAWNNETEPSAT